MLVEKCFDTGEVVLNYAEGPHNGPPLVILPGYIWRWQGYIPIINHLKEHYHIFAVDARGRGKSGHTPGKYYFNDIIKDHIEFLSNIVKEAAIIFGHSLGGWITMKLAQETPSHVKAIIVGDSSLCLETYYKIVKDSQDYYIEIRATLDKSYDKVYEFVSNGSPEFSEEKVKLFTDTFTSCDPKIVDFYAEGRLAEFFGDYNPYDSLSVVACPVLIVQGNFEEGGILPDDEVKKALLMNKMIQHTQLVDCDHWLGIQDGRDYLFIEAIQPFLSSL
jgi:pimeloyl-ACP methyl ester carboxylesterase